MSALTDGGMGSEAAGLAGAAQLLVAGGSLSETLSGLAELAKDASGASTVVIGLRGDSGAVLDFAAVAGGSVSEFVGLRVLVDDSVADEAIHFGVTGPSPGHAPLPEASPHTVSAPIRDGHRVLGALIASWPSGEATAAGSGLLPAFAAIIAAAVARYRLADEAAALDRRLRALVNTTATIGGSLNVAETLEAVLDAVESGISHQAAAVFLLNDERTHLFIGADRGLNAEQRDVQLSPETGPAAEALATGSARILALDAGDPTVDVLPFDVPPRSVMLLPLRGRRDSVGLLVVVGAHSAAFDGSDLHLMEAVTVQAGVAVENAWLFEESTRRTEEATALFNLSQQAGALLDPDHVFDLVASQVQHLLNVDQFAVLTLDRRTGRLVARCIRGLDGTPFATLRPAAGEGIAGWVYEWMTPTAVSDVAADARNRVSPIHDCGVVSCLCVPMAAGEQVLGVVMAMTSRRRLFTVGEMELLYTIANQAAISSDNAALYQSARDRSAAMRRYFRTIAGALGSAIEREDVPLLLAKLCLDVVEADRAVVWACGPDGLTPAADAGRRSGGVLESLPPGAGLSGWVARRGRSLVTQAISDDERSRAEPWLTSGKYASYLGVPLRAEGRVTAVLALATELPRVYAASEVQLLRQFALRARVAERIA
ncbi:MAG: GAF domain-containing protein [Armatimonadetes bacterium]|nr:GAF domain-containing protein [Armatimonadota bacterium]